ncbi:hypothetical protein ARSEF1564_010247 [Beauveria bassiana]
MGGAGATSEAISNSRVVASMLENLNGLYGPPSTPTGNNDKDAELLRGRLYEYNKKRFFEEFSYRYQRNQTRPERWDQESEVIGKDGFASFPVEQSEQVRWYVENRIVQGHLPQKEKNNFKADVVDMVNSLIDTDSYGWQADEFVRTYSGLRVEGMIIWDVINAPDPSGTNPTSQRLMVLHYD